jgi:hypothetical protein
MQVTALMRQVIDSPRHAKNGQNRGTSSRRPLEVR